MKNFILYILLIIVLGTVLFNLWNSKDIMVYAQNGAVLLVSIIVYKLISRSDTKLSN